MTDLKSMTLEEITVALRAMGEPQFRGKQVHLAASRDHRF